MHNTAPIVTDYSENGSYLTEKWFLVFPLMFSDCFASTLWLTEVPESNLMLQVSFASWLCLKHHRGVFTLLLQQLCTERGVFRSVQPQVLKWAPEQTGLSSLYGHNKKGQKTKVDVDRGKKREKWTLTKWVDLVMSAFWLPHDKNTWACMFNMYDFQT